MSPQLFVEPLPSLWRTYFRMHYWQRELLTCHANYFRRGQQYYLCISDKPCPNYLYWADKIDQSEQILFCLLFQCQYLTIAWDGEKLITLMLSQEIPTFLFDGLSERSDFIPTVYFDVHTEAYIKSVGWLRMDKTHKLTTNQLLLLQKAHRKLFSNGRLQSTFLVCGLTFLLLAGIWLYVEYPSQSIQQLPIQVAQEEERQAISDPLLYLFMFPEWLKREPEIYATNYQLELKKGQLEFSTTLASRSKKQALAVMALNSKDSVDSLLWGAIPLVSVENNMTSLTQISGNELQSSISQSFITNHVVMTIRTNGNEADILIRKGWIEDLASLAQLFKRFDVTLTAAHITGMESQINGTLSVSWGG